MKSLLLCALSLAASVSAWGPHGWKDGRGLLHPAGWEKHPHHPPSSPSNITFGNSTFEQYIDHENPSLGTFSQFYYWSSEFWAGPGSPVILFTPGEINVTGYQSYTTINRTTGVLASEIGAAVIVLEHRYWGVSSPYAELTTENLQYLTLKNSIKDLTTFAQNARLPFDYRRTSNPKRAPWLLMGGSYSGALSAWTASTDPGTFWAYYASSAPVEAIENYWEYFVPVQEGMPQNCSKDVSLVIDHIDSVFLNGTAEEQYALKEMFGLQDLEHAADFASAIENGPWLWQSNQFYKSGGFYQWCDDVEGITPNSTNTTLPGADGVGLTTALAGYAAWFNTTFLPGTCASYGYAEWQDPLSVACFNTYNASSPMYTDTSLSNTFDRQWYWFLCNQPFGYWQNGAPRGRPSIVSRLVDDQWNNRQCPLFFPPEDGYVVGEARGRTEEEVNEYTLGWEFTNSSRLLWVNGGFDPWREAGVSSDFRPGGPLQSTSEAPVIIVPGGFHTSDLITQNGQVNAGAKAAIDAAIAQMKTWVAEFPEGGLQGSQYSSNWGPASGSWN